MSKRIYLEDLFDEIRSLTEQYQTDEAEPDAIVLKPNETNAFAEDLIKVVKDFLERETELELEDDIELDDDDDLIWIDDDDEELE